MVSPAILRRKEISMTTRSWGRQRFAGLRGATGFIGSRSWCRRVTWANGWENFWFFYRLL
jgi:hypothetical protein